MSGRLHYIKLTPGTPYIAWCDKCLRSHAHADIYTTTERGVTHLGVWHEGHKAEEDSP